MGYSAIMPAKLIAQKEIQVGEPVVIQAISPSQPYVAVFEDDGQTGYFYALDSTRTGRDPILDALHIYNVESITDRALASTVQIVWSDDDLKVALLINSYSHAVFDFTARRGYCRTGYPPPAPDGWTKHSHEWDDAAQDLF